MQIPPHYRTLGLEPDASRDEIKSAYRHLAKRHHPDANAGDIAAEELFKRITAAYQVLGDPVSRREYDRTHAYIDSSARRAERHSKRAARDKGRDVHIKLYLTIEEACKGGFAKVKYPRDSICVVCDGDGYPSGKSEVCSACKGQGLVKFDHSVKISYPAGIRSDETLIISGAGHVDQPSVSAGDLYVKIAYKPHPYFEVNGNDIYYRCLIGLDTYIEGGQLRLPTTQGAISIPLDSRFPDGGTIRLNGRGLPARNGFSIGDMVITVNHCLPKRLSRKEKDKIKEIMDLPSFSPPADENGLFPRAED